MRLAPLLLALPAFLAACASDGPGASPHATAPASDAEGGPGERPPSVAADTFAAYWYRGQAELTSYRLSQARYGAVREGEAVLIYVTEPFSRRRQVKVDDAAVAGDDAETVLKLNATRSFVTGIYPYSMMTSVFTPVDLARPTRKVTTTAQEWCGHTFTQLNRARDGWSLRAFSYFEREGDRTLSLPDVWLEDAVWTTLRLDPTALPTGEVTMLPGTTYQRLSHTAFEPQDARATLRADSADAALRVYTVAYPALERTLRIRFRAAFPHEVEGWEETYPDGGRPLTTRATRTERRRLAYWELNAPGDERWRDSLALGGVAEP